MVFSDFFSFHSCNLGGYIDKYYLTCLSKLHKWFHSYNQTHVFVKFDKKNKIINAQKTKCTTPINHLQRQKS